MLELIHVDHLEAIAADIGSAISELTEWATQNPTPYKEDAAQFRHLMHQLTIAQQAISTAIYLA